MAVTLFNGFGRPITSAASGVDLYKSAQDDGTNLPRPNLNQDIATLLSLVKHRALISDARHIFATFPVVKGGATQKADYVTQAGFDPVFYGKDKAWGRRAREAIMQAHRVIDVRGPLYWWNKDWHIGCTMLDVDGSFFIVRGETDTGYPQLQFIEAHRVGCRYGLREQEVDSGPYKGLRILNGVIYNAFGREVAYRVLGSTPEQDRDISALDMHHVADPQWFSDGRPFPSIAYAILDWYDAKESRGFQRLKQKINSALTIIETTPTGKAPDDLPPMPGVAPAPATVASAQPLLTQLAGGLIRYVKSGAGDIKSHGDNTPGDGWLRFDERIVAGAFVGMGWRAEMLNLASTGTGAPTRAFQDQINTAIYARWLVLQNHALSDDLWILRKLIKRGDLPDNDEWWKFRYVPPADFTVDGGRSNKADLDNVRSGTDSIPAIIGRFGRTPEDVLREQAEYLQLKTEMEDEYELPAGSLGTMAYPGWPGQSFPAIENTPSPQSVPPSTTSP